jgi:hypothetical protein
VNTSSFGCNNTQISGLCKPNAAGLELQQRHALSLLPKLLHGFGKFNIALQRLLHKASNLGNSVGDGETLLTPYEYLTTAPGSPSPRRH